ncbi:hypothetical protein AGR5A_Lc70134 [Agrobacterium genomosp. 5 str. CFBP 6626]|nr:hypothetical protein AGR5A_Lc70134 [Agrobacterium genomosp. 5 str. CFBP 6626]
MTGMNDGLVHQQLDTLDINILTPSEKRGLLFQSLDYGVSSLPFLNGALRNLSRLLSRSTKFLDPPTRVFHLP